MAKIILREQSSLIMTNYQKIKFTSTNIYANTKTKHILKMPWIGSVQCLKHAYNICNQRVNDQAPTTGVGIEVINPVAPSRKYI